MRSRQVYEQLLACPIDRDFSAGMLCTAMPVYKLDLPTAKSGSSRMGVAVYLPRDLSLTTQAEECTVQFTFEPGTLRIIMLSFALTNVVAYVS